MRYLLASTSLRKHTYTCACKKVYTPDFSRCVDFYCVHAGGRGVLDGVEKNLRLTPRHLEPSRQTLYRYGNTSSSSIWYEMEYICEHMDLKPGQRVLQVRGWWVDGGWMDDRGGCFMGCSNKWIDGWS